MLWAGSLTRRAVDLMAAPVDACPLIAIWLQRNQKLTEVYDVTVCGQTRFSSTKWSAEAKRG